ncbi:MAG TPA: glycosyltransferase family 2 protein [Blastocatellia bacterium]|nr:glycosyltransferase family 2 protein [Blastocatellia bacterium]
MSNIHLTQQLIAQIVFFFAAAMIAYIYIGYPILMFVLSRLFPHPVRRTSYTPRVSLIIAAHNEEKDIARKLDNALSLDYPQDKLEIIVASDCSTDGTDRIVNHYRHLHDVILHRQNERHGKTRAQCRAVGVSTGEILVFSDATTEYEPDALRKIVESFGDSTVGCVAGQLIYVDGKSSVVGKGCRSYWNYEKLIKHSESELGSLIGVSGCMYAVRRSCYARLASDMIDDFVIATEIRLQGLRTVYEPEAIAKEDTNHRTRDEFRMRVRVIEQTMSAIYRYRQILNPFKHGLFAFQMISHKILRYSVPLWLALVLVANWFAQDAGSLYQYFFIMQLWAYAAALTGWIGERAKISLGPLAVPYYFVLVNVAIVCGFVKYLRGQSHVVWEPVRDSRSEAIAPQR